MTDAELGKYLQQKDWLHWDTDSVDEAAMTVLVALLREARIAGADFLNIPAVIQAVGNKHTPNCPCPQCHLEELVARLRVVLGEGQ